MGGAAIAFMLFGMAFLWGGLTVSILHYMKMDKLAGSSGYSDED